MTGVLNLVLHDALNVPIDHPARPRHALNPDWDPAPPGRAAAPATKTPQGGLEARGRHYTEDPDWDAEAALRSLVEPLRGGGDRDGHAQLGPDLAADEDPDGYEDPA
jgi:hypothetical protein